MCQFEDVLLSAAHVTGGDASCGVLTNGVILLGARALLDLGFAVARVRE